MTEKKAGRKEIDFTEGEVLAAIKGSCGIMARVAKNLSCEWSTAKKYVERFESAKLAMDDELETVLDTAENNLFQAINSKDIDAIKWFLSRKGRARGYADRTEFTGKDGGPIETNLSPVWVITKPPVDGTAEAEEAQ